MFSRTKLLCTVPLGFSSRRYAANQSLFPHPVKSQDSYGVLKALRQNPALATIPFIFLTAKADKMDLRRGMELGANDYMTKPFTRLELLGAIAPLADKNRNDISCLI
jgi:CheY-like chemotaxis protein